MPHPTRIQDCIDHHEEYVLALAAMPDRRLREKLDTIHLQMALAERQRNTDAIELLEIWRMQTIEARTYKAENNIADAPNEIEEVAATVGTYIPPAAEPVESDIEAAKPMRLVRTKAVPDDSSEQLSFF